MTINRSTRGAAVPAADEYHPDIADTSPPQSRSSWWLNERNARIAGYAAALLALAICFDQLRRPGVLFGLNEYDDGVYLGAAIRLAHGHLPYQSFEFPHPPGIPLLFSPLALLGRIGSTRTLMAMVRLITAFVAAGNVFLIGRLLRHRGVLAVLAGSLGLAVFPLAMTANKTLLIEPYVILFSLLGLSLLFVGDAPARERRLLWAGVTLGFALTIKLWAAIPIFAVLVVFAPRWRECWKRLGGGLVAGSVLPCLPFFLAAPSGFVRQILTLQLQRGESDGALSSRERIVLTTGVRTLGEMAGANALALALGLAFVSMVAIAYVVSGRLRALDGVLLGSAFLAVLAVMTSSDYFMHYSYFTAALLALAGGAALGAFASVLGRTRADSGASGGERRSSSGLPWQSALVTVLVAGTLAGASVGVIRGRGLLDRVPGLLTAGDPGPAVAAAIPRGACVITDEPSLTITADRFVSDRRCPVMVDPFYVWLAADPKRLPPAPPPYAEALVARWRVWLEEAEFAVFSDYTFRVPWSVELTAWFDANFEAVARPGPTVYRKVSSG